MRREVNCIKALLILFVMSICTVKAQQDSASENRLTHADAAIILTKYSGYFDRYVALNMQDAKCVEFLNQKGIYFDILYVIKKEEFTVKDCARSMGQIDLLLSGHAEFSMGKVKLPKEFDSWEEFCIMHGVDYTEGYHAMLKILSSGKE